MSRLIAALVSLAFIIFVFGGWVMNLLGVLSAQGTELIIRIVGIFVFPLGVVAGWFL
jgi:small neutral amino acid transporter SnatA (MarC family)